jgi:hypothetical protein
MGYGALKYGDYYAEKNSLARKDSEELSFGSELWRYYIEIQDKTPLMK